MALDVYRQKRDFRTTPEPRGKAARRRSTALSFVIQKHAASHLHYDFRLELNGVMLSWAVPKGPSLDPADKRLAVHVEDHPLEYGNFEGVIPARQYGSGTVMVWDRGTWIPKEDPAAGYPKGRLKFALDGEKLKGGWMLVRSHGSKYGGKRGDKAWLLIKENDEFARRGVDAHIIDSAPDSVLSGRSMDDIAQDRDRVWHSNRSVEDNVRSGATKPKRSAKSKAGSDRIALADVAGAKKMSRCPALVSPTLATLVSSIPQGEEWIHEIKYDGYRMLCRIEGGEVRIYSRNGKEWTAALPGVAAAAGRLRVETAWLDGEVTVATADGHTSFQALQNALDDPKAATLIYFIFDLPYLNGYDLRNVELIERKRLLEQVLAAAPDALRYSSHVQGSGSEFLEQACRLGLEGAISKLATSAYSGKRGRDWVKTKCTQRQEMVIGGFTEPQRTRTGIGALLLGVYEPDGSLRYSGKVGTGFDNETLASLRSKLERLEQSKAPFSNPPRGFEAKGVHWVKPELVAEVSFAEWTAGGTLRHASFHGLRKDKKAAEVVRERPQTRSRSNVSQTTKSRKRPSRSTAGSDAASSVAGIALSHPDKLLYPDAKLSKLDLARYYEAIGDWIVPHLKDRPLSLVRCPDGWKGQCFYQKHAQKSVNAAVGRVSVPEGKGHATYLMANSVPAVVSLVQWGTLELHPWGSRQPKLDRPDRLTFDFDPDDAVAWEQLAEGVVLLRTLLEEIGLAGFLKTTGGKGLHVVVPIRPTLDWDRAKEFTKAIAELLVHTFPDRFIATMSKSQRKGKIFVDYLRNAEGATAVCAYSPRARANAPVATPIEWDELQQDVRLDYFNVRNVPRRLSQLKADPWHEFFTVKQSVTVAMQKRVGAASAK